MNYKCFLIECTDRRKLSLRRYTSSGFEGSKCPGRYGYHNAHTPIGEALESEAREQPPHDDERWPKRCEYCDYVFDNADDWQLFTEQIWRRADTGAEFVMRDAPVGAMWNASWLADCAAYAGPDGKSYVVRMPGGHEWMIDGRASNCDSPCKNCGRPYHQHESQKCEKGYEDARPHKCWIRHGTAPLFTVDKNGPTCNAGAGSILVPGWHGFLRDGELQQC